GASHLPRAPDLRLRPGRCGRGADGRAPDRGLAAAYQPSLAHRGAAPAGARADGDRLRVPAGPQRALHLLLAADRSVRGDVRSGADTPRRLRPPGGRAVAASVGARGDAPCGAPAPVSLLTQKSLARPRAAPGAPAAWSPRTHAGTGPVAAARG